MAKIAKVMTLFIFVLGSFTFVNRDAHAQITHVSINQKLFSLGEYPKFRLNIVSESGNYSKMQFVVQQGGSEERLMVKPINKFLLLLTGVEDVVDPSARLVIREYRVNKWRDVKRFELFSGDEQHVTPRAKKKVLESEIKRVESRLVQLQGAGALNDGACQLSTLPGQTLWRIATQYSKEWGMSPQGGAVAIYEANPQAFSAESISSLRADSKLMCPSDLIKNKYKDPNVAQRTYKALLN